MNTLANLLLAGSLAALPISASAFKFAPAPATFGATGVVTLTVPTGAQYECRLTIRGATGKKGVAKISVAVFSPGASACANTAAVGLPWIAKAVSATTGKIFGFDLATPFGPCGPATVAFTDSASGVWTIANAALPPSCILGASLPTSPPIVIVP